MLAYVFWHWAVADHVRGDYERLQREFQAALTRSAPRGFLRSYVFRVDGRAPWLGGTPSYADWYVVEDFAALEPLNAAAVTGVCQEPHARVAQAMAAGAGSLYTLHGEPAADSIAAARTLAFLTKPRDMPYADFYPAVPTNAQTSLWRRTMVLGPSPEFALLTQGPQTGLDRFQPLSLAVNPIWP